MSSSSHLSSILELKFSINLNNPFNLIMGAELFQCYMID